jgi:hypothetical protein
MLHERSPAFRQGQLSGTAPSCLHKTCSLMVTTYQPAKACHKACDSSKGTGSVLQSIAMRLPQITSPGRSAQERAHASRVESSFLRTWPDFRRQHIPCPSQQFKQSQQACVSRRASACPQHSPTTGLALSPTHQTGSTLRLPALMFSLMVRSTTSINLKPSQYHIVARCPEVSGNRPAITEAILELAWMHS